MRAMAMMLGAGMLVLVSCAGEPAKGEGGDSTAVAPASAVTALASAPDKAMTRGDVTINYRVVGEGEPVLLVHGYGDNLNMWTWLADSLSRGHRVIVVDTRGFGKSSKPAGAEQYGMKMVDDLVALLDHERVAKVHVVGYSMGAMIAATMALSHPDRVRTATLAAGSFRKDAATMRAMVAPWVADLEGGRRLTTLIKDIVPSLPDSVARSFSDQLFAESDSAALVGVMKSFADFSVDWSKVSATRIPAVIIVGADDPLRPYSADLAGKWVGGRHVEIPATDHMTIFTSPTLLAEVRALVAANPTEGGTP